MTINFTITNPISYKNLNIGILIKTIIFYIVYLIIFGYSFLFPYSLKDLKLPESRRYSDNELEKLGYIFKQNYFFNIGSLGLFKIKKDVNNNVIGLNDWLKFIIVIIYSYVFLLIIYVAVTIYAFYLISPLLNYTKLNDSTSMDSNLISKGKYKKTNIVGYIMKMLPIFFALIIPIVLMIFKSKVQERSFQSLLITIMILLPFILANSMYKKSVLSSNKTGSSNILNNLYSLLDNKDYKWLDTIISKIKIFYFSNSTFLLILIICLVMISFYNNPSPNPIFNVRNILMFIMIGIIIPFYIAISIINITSNCYDPKHKCDILDGTSLININSDLKNKGMNSLYQGMIKYNIPCFYK